MALFGKLFEKKNCAICGKELGVFGKTKISEGHLCKECAGKLSPYFHGYRRATAEDIRAQLAYREENERQLQSFNPTTTIDGGDKKLYLDEGAGKLIITSSDNWRNSNPDLIELSQVTGCETEVRESKTEIRREDAEGNKVSYDPPRYDIDYDIYVKVYFNHPYFSEISWRVNRSRIDRKNSTEFRDAEQRAQGVKAALTGIRQQQRAAAAPKAPVTCPNCLATTMPDASLCCPYCGSSLASVIEAARPAPAQQEGQPATTQGPAQQAEAQRSERDYYDERDYGEGGPDQRGYQQAPSQASTRPRVTGQAKADFRRQQSR